MESLRTVQTAFRFRPDLVSRMKNKARLLGKSLNSYVEEVIEKDLAPQEDKYGAIYEVLAEIKCPETVSPEVLSLSRFRMEFTEEDLQQDERLAYLLEK